MNQGGGRNNYGGFGRGGGGGGRGWGGGAGGYGRGLGKGGPGGGRGRNTWEHREQQIDDGKKEGADENPPAAENPNHKWEQAARKSKDKQVSIVPEDQGS